MNTEDQAIVDTLVAEGFARADAEAIVAYEDMTLDGYRGELSRYPLLEWVRGADNKDCATLYVSYSSLYSMSESPSRCITPSDSSAPYLAVENELLAKAGIDRRHVVIDTYGIS